jgi:energy-coupling factor transporter ATP-binding protein EcfA2
MEANMSEKNDYPFLKSLRINHVRHLKELDIEIDTNRPRHLILTGPNGCGKTSVLWFLKQHLEGIPSRQLVRLEADRNDNNLRQSQITRLKEQQNNATDDLQKAVLQGQIQQIEAVVLGTQRQIESFEALVPQISGLTQLVELYHKGEFLIAFFDAKRTSSIQAVTGVQKLSLPKLNPIVISKDSLSSKFLQYLVNQINRQAMLHQKGDVKGVQEIDRWMADLTERFRTLFQNDSLELKYDIDEMDFRICMQGREPFRFVNNELSDGFSAVIQIISELLLRMEAVSKGDYRMPGIVLIDEIETHLHIELQKLILPFLTEFFPNIQFVVTTHSPFVLTSLPDAVVFDLQSHKREECMAPLSASTVVEDYFESDLYSAESKRMIGRFEELVKTASLSDVEQDELNTLKQQLDLLVYDDSPELVAHYRHLVASERRG